MATSLSLSLSLSLSPCVSHLISRRLSCRLSLSLCCSRPLYLFPNHPPRHPAYIRLRSYLLSLPLAHLLVTARRLAAPPAARRQGPGERRPRAPGGARGVLGILLLLGAHPGLLVPRVLPRLLLVDSLRGGRVGLSGRWGQERGDKEMWRQTRRAWKRRRMAVCVCVERKT